MLCFIYHLIILSKPDCFQSDINRFKKWCQYNLLNLSYLKCNVMGYPLQNMSLGRIYSCNDLRVLLDPKLKFDSHITSTVNTAMSVLGFIKRWSEEFNDPYTTKLLFTALVRFSLDNWNPQYQVQIGRLESVQKQFHLFALGGLICSSTSIPVLKTKILTCFSLILSIFCPVFIFSMYLSHEQYLPEMILISFMFCVIFFPLLFTCHL